MEDALEDLSVAGDLLRSGHHAASCFHSQQAAEKAVKAVLYLNRVEAKGHSVMELLAELANLIGHDLSGFEDDARLLDKHYSPTRYPNLHPGISLPSHKLYSRGDAERCLESARRVVEYMRKLLQG